MTTEGNVCDRCQALLAARLDGVLEASDSGQLDAHLLDCGDCRSLADTLEPGGQLIKAVFPRVDPCAYELGPVVACGGMGRIRIARDLRIGRRVVIKELLVNSDAHAARFVREARVAARLQHPGIIPIYEVGSWADGTPFYAMRLVEGRSLYRMLNAATSLDERMQLVPSVIAAADAVAFAHATGVVHRDLTPANILLGDFGETVVIDWGLAKDLRIDLDHNHRIGPRFRSGVTQQMLTGPGEVIGTPAYMPREQAAGDPTDERGDVYALGAILYHILTGRPPYEGRSIVAQVVSASPPPLADGVPPVLASIVTKAMARNANDRYTTAHELAAELRRFQAGLLVGAHRYSIGERFARWCRSHRMAASSAAVVVVAALSLVIGT